jgi:antitoxin-like ribbon-helix-helix protein
MSNKADLATLLGETSGSARHRKPLHTEIDAPKSKPVKGASRSASTVPITVHLPKNVRDQLKILAVQEDKKLHGLIAEAFNDLFAKYGKPEIAPVP